MVTVMRVRCTRCKKNYSLVTRIKKIFKEGETLKLTCKKIKEKYPSAKGCNQTLVFFRYQGKRIEKPDDLFLEDLIPQDSEKKT